MSDERPIGYIHWEIHGATAIYADDPHAIEIPTLHEDDLWEFVERDDADSTDAYWEPAP